VTIFGKIGRRLLAWFIFIALIPLLFMGYQGYFFARRAVQREVFLHMETVAKAKRSALDYWFNERLADMRVLAADPLLVNCLKYSAGHRLPCFEQVALLLNVFQKQSQSYACACLYDAQGIPIICTKLQQQMFPDFEKSELFYDAVASPEPIFGPIYLDTNIGPGMHLAAAVRDSSGAIVGILVGTLALKNTLNPIILDSTGLGRTGQAYLVDRNKVMLTPSRFMNHPEPLKHTMDSEGIQQALRGVDGAAVYTGFDGRPVLGAWYYLPRYQWALIAEMNADEAFLPLAALRRYALIVALLTLGGIIVVVAWISRSLSAPIRMLAEASLDVSRGNLHRQVNIRRRDELGELADRFNAMIISLRDSRVSLEKAYDELVRTQRQLVQSEKLAAVGALVASVVHEIRNPLSAIKMNLRILEMKCAVDSVTAEHFQLARVQTDRLETMLSELLNYSKPIALNRMPVSLPELIQTTLTNSPTIDAQPPLKISVNTTGQLPLLSLDSERMQQVILNLLINAQQAMPNGGAIDIQIAPSAWEGKASIVIRISDQGCGIAPENLPHVFEPFFTTRKQGTGLGLSNAQKIVEAHGGTLQLRSTVGVGTESRIYLPIEV
jgi:signal transduction histidine kinase